MRRFAIFNSADVEWAGFMSRPPHFGARRPHRTAAQKAGVRYERRAEDYLTELFPESYIQSPWLAFRLKHEPMLRYCQPDGLNIDIERARVDIVEIKLRHCVEAYVQVTGIYDPVVRRLFPGWDIRHIELTRWFDPGIPFPVPVQKISDLSLAPKGRFAVHIWNP